MGSSSSDEDSERPLSGDRNVSAKHDLMKKQEVYIISHVIFEKFIF